MNLGQRIRDLRMSKGLTQAQLAKRAGVSQPTIHSYERNPKTAHRAAVLFKIAAALEVSPEFLEHGRGPVGLEELPHTTTQLVAIFGELTEDQRALLLSVARSLKHP